jgi:hypothetical protein
VRRSANPKRSLYPETGQKKRGIGSHAGAAFALGFPSEARWRLETLRLSTASARWSAFSKLRDERAL